MNKIFWICLFFFHFSFPLIFSDTIYITGQNNTNDPLYWTIVTPNAPSSFQQLNIGSNNFGVTTSVAISPNQTAYIVGGVSDIAGDAEAVYWTVPPSGSASNFNALSGISDIFQVTAYGTAFSPSGIGYIVGIDESDNPTYWTVSPTGVISSPTELAVGGFALAVGFSSSGAGFIAGADSSDNVCYWSISPSGTITGPFGLVGGEAGGVATAYFVATSPSGITYIVGANTGGFACYWTISPGGVASSAVILDGGSNSLARGVAFLPSGEGIIVGQTAGNVSSYWIVSPSGSVGTFNALPNGSGNASSANGVAFSSNMTAYMVGIDNTSQPVYWTLPLSSNTPGYNILDTGGSGGIAYSIAIYFPLGPNPPSNLSGRYVINDFGWLYEYSAVLNWTPSNSNGVVAYNIYKNGIKIATVSGSINQYQDHNQRSKIPTTYSVTAVDGSGNESPQAVITIQ